MLGSNEIIIVYMSDAPTLEKAFEVLGNPVTYPGMLPLTHVTKIGNLTSIAETGQLIPQKHEDFDDELTFFFYGGVFYYAVFQFFQEEVEMPVAFVFKPSISSSFNQYYPFDTGAISKRLPDEWKEKMNGYKETFKISQKDEYTLQRLVHHLFETNKNYIDGNFSRSLRDKPNPLPLLFEFYDTNLSKINNSDHRQCSIECQTHSSVKFFDNLRWIGFPESCTKYILPLLEHLKKDPPIIWKYKSHRIFNPALLTHDLQTAAYEQFIEPIVDLS